MRIPGQHQRQPALQGEAMTPMIDVVFLLLVFFVCASIGQLPDSLLPAELAAGVTEVEVPYDDTEDPEHQEVRIGLRPGTAAGTLTMQLNEGSVPSAAELRDRLLRLAKIDPDTRIVLDIHDDVSVQQFIRIYDLCQALGFQAIFFGTRSVPVE